MFRLTLLALAAILSLPATDPFTTPGPLSANWTQNGAGTWAIDVSNDLTFVGTFSVIWWNADTFTADQSSSFQITNNFAGPACRVDPSAITFYAFYTNDAGIYKWVGGSRSSIGSYSGGNFAPGEIPKVVCTGTSPVKVEVFRSGVSQGFANDSSSPITTGAPGIFADLGNAFAAGAWIGDDVGGPTATFPGAIINAPVRGGGRRHR